MFDTLKVAGLTEYEARVYLELVAAGSLTAKQVSQESGVPYTRIYDVISRLEKKGWIEKEEGRPIRVFATAPNTLIGKAAKHRNKKMAVKKCGTQIFNLSTS